MKVFIKKILLFLFLISIIKVLTEVCIPYYFPSTYFLQKKTVWDKSETNSIIFGSSRSYRHMDPAILNKNLQGFEFFNFGIPAMVNPELYLLFENFIEELDSGQIKLITLELSMLDTLQKQNIGLLRGHHWNTPEVLLYSLDYIKKSSWPKELKEETRSKYLRSFRVNLLSLKKIKTLVDGLRNYFGFEFHIMNQYGFYSLNKEVEENPILQSRRDYFLNDTTILHSQKLDANDADGFIDGEFNEAHLKRLLKMKQIADSKGIKLLLIIPPKLTALEYKELIPIKGSVLSDIVIDTHSPEEYPFAYSDKYSFDHGHLNKEGSDLYSEKLSQEIERKIISADGF